MCTGKIAILRKVVHLIMTYQAARQQGGYVNERTFPEDRNAQIVFIRS